MPLHRACALSELSATQPFKAIIEGQPLMLAMINGQPKATHSICLHRGADLSSNPILDGQVTCHLHFWAFRFSDGVCTQVPSAKLKVFETQIQGEDVYVEI